MNNKSKGILGLLAVAAGALGFWKYKNMTPEEKANLKAKAKKAGDTIKETYDDVEGQVSEKLTQLKDALEVEKLKAKQTFSNDGNDITDAIEVEALKTEQTVNNTLDKVADAVS